MNKITQEEIEYIKKQLIEKFKPSKIILFGSFARGDFNANSDFDFLVVKNDDRRPLDVEQELHKTIDYHLASDFLFISQKDFQKRLRNNDFFLKEVLSSGKILYDRIN